MATPQRILQDLQHGYFWRSDLAEKLYGDKTNGCGCCGDGKMECFDNVVDALKFRTDLGIFDEVTDKLHSDMMELMGPVEMPDMPVVDAGPDVTVQEPVDYATLNGSVTAGDAPIDTIQWTQVSGPSVAVFTDPTSPVTDISGLVVGTYVFELSAVDTDGYSGSDQTVVKMEAAVLQAYYGYTSDGSIPSESDILSSASVPISGNSFVVPFTDNGSPRFMWVAYPLSFPVMNRWDGMNSPLNNGHIGDVTDLFGPYSTVGTMRVTATQYGTQLSNTLFEE